MSYTVGQVVYLLSKKDIKVFPALVIEEIKRKTLDKEIISYVIKLPDKKMSEVILEEVDAEIFVSLKDLEKQMIKNAKSQISLLLEKAKKASEVFPVKESQDVNIHKPAENTDSDVAKVDLGNGRVGKINLSEIQTRG